MRLSAVLLTAALGSLTSIASAQFSQSTPVKSKSRVTSTAPPSGGGLFVGGADDCASAEVIAGPGSFFFDNSLATTGTEGQSESLCYAFNTTAVITDVWFDWTADFDGTVLVDTCGSSTDTKIAAYPGAGCPATGTALDCNDDSCSLQSEIQFPVVDGQTYAIQVGLYPFAAGGTGMLNIAAAPLAGCPVMHSGSSDNSIGLTYGGETCYMYYVDCMATIDTIEAAYGTPASPGRIANGSPVTLAVWDDPTNDAEPSDAVLITTIPVPAGVTNADTDILNVYPTGGIAVTGGTWVGVVVTQVAGEFPATLDGASNGFLRNWVAGATLGTGLPFNYSNLLANDVPPLENSFIGFPGAWLMQVSGTEIAGGMPTTIYGMDFRSDRFYTSEPTDFVGGWTSIGTNSDAIHALDFDAAGTTLWGIDGTSLMNGTFDLTTGVFTPLVVVPGITGATGITCATDGTWYLCEYNATTATSDLWVGDVTAGILAWVGTIAGGGEVIIDISVDSQGNLYGHSISTDVLFSIDTVTGAGTVVGSTGLDANSAQGMDFDWSTDTLYATVCTGGGTGKFCAFDLNTGEAIVLQDTLVLDAEMEMACLAGTGTFGPGIPYCSGAEGCFCGNNNDGSMSGCDWQNAGGGAAGASLDATGSNYAAAINTFLAADNVSGDFGVFFAANGQVTGFTLSDGIRCAGHGLIRMTPPTASGSSTATHAAPLQVLDPAAAPGTTRYYQYWFRTSPGACTNLANTTNGYFIHWM